MKLASITYDGEKKNPESVALDGKTIDFIIPASFYKTTAAPVKPKTEVKIAPVVPTTNVATPPTVNPIPVETSKTVTPEPVVEVSNLPLSGVAEPDVKIKIDINIPNKRVSGLSISSIKAKKEHEIEKKGNAIDESQLPRETFTEEELQKHWNYFVDEIENKGQKILASNLASDVPKLKDANTIWIELPNDTMKKEVEREQYDLIEFLKLKLNNYAISLFITVSETAAKKYAFTPEEKYEKLREKNPAIDILRQEFDLDL